MSEEKHPISVGQPTRDELCWRQHRDGYVCILPEGHELADRPRRELEPGERVVFLPVHVMYEGLADTTNGPYFKGRFRMSPANQPEVRSISESEVLDYGTIEEDLRIRIATQIMDLSLTGYEGVGAHELPHMDAEMMRWLCAATVHAETAKAIVRERSAR